MPPSVKAWGPDRAAKAGGPREEFVRLLNEAFVEPQGGPHAAAAIQPQASPVPAPASPSRVAAFSKAPGRTDNSLVLATGVLKFVDEHRSDGDHPYSFLQIFTPLLHKHITISEENSKLSEFDLSPTCTLVLVPACLSPASAYSGGRGSTEGGRIFSRIYGLFYTIVTNTLAVGYHPPIPAPVNAELGKGQGQAPSRGEAPGTRIRALHDGRGSDGEEADRKYYKGNQFDFEPRRDKDSSEVID
ncbi:hypothetical protein HOY80DRAFT_1141138 [Tuber brumale]|nr:hypothetical protein HOY80DRAFT_1141138 [Tuber brumale]